ncbi:MAG: hypothetical protein AAF458_14030 [Pseudomonadota bacterium]
MWDELNTRKPTLLLRLSGLLLLRLSARAFSGLLTHEPPRNTLFEKSAARPTGGFGRQRDQHGVCVTGSQVLFSEALGGDAGSAEECRFQGAALLGLAICGASASGSWSGRSHRHCLRRFLAREERAPRSLSAAKKS